MTEQAHSKLGASGAERWMNCPGSLRMSEGIPNETSEAAAEGTAAHALGELCMMLGFQRAEVLVYSEVEGFQVTEEMAEAVQVYLDETYPHILSGNPYSMEQKFDLEWVHKGMFGTNDFCAYDPETKILHVIDYKHGRGYVVEIEANKQLMYYAVGALKDYPEAETVELCIVQPRAFHQSGRVRKELYSAEWLRTVFVERLRDAAVATEAPDAPLNAGSWCTFCPAKGLCPAIHNKVTGVIGAMENYKLPETQKLQPIDVKSILDAKDDIIKWLNAVEFQALKSLEAGLEIPEYKLVRGNKHRAFIDKEAAKEELLENFGEAVLAPRELLSLGKLETAIKSIVKDKKIVDSVISPLVFKPLGDITIAHVSDKRSAVEPNVNTQLTENLENI